MSQDNSHRVAIIATTLGQRLPDVHPDTLAALAVELESQFAIQQLREKLTGSPWKSDPRDFNDPWAGGESEPPF